MPGWVRFPNLNYLQPRNPGKYSKECTACRLSQAR